MRARLVIGLAVIGLLIGSADCKKKPANGGIGTASEAAKGRIDVKDADFTGHDILDAATGAEVGEVSKPRSILPLPPGAYTIDLDGKKAPFTIEIGKPTVLKR